MRIFTLLATTALLATPALAADAIVNADPVSTAIIDTFSWTGGYVGVSAGYAWGKSPFLNVSSIEDGYTEGTDYDPDGFFGGIYTGYNKQFTNNVVLGVDADLNLANVKSKNSVYASESYNLVFNEKPFAKIKWNGAVRARLGYAYDRVLPYIASGVSFGEYEFGLNRTSGRVIFSEKPTITGWNIGAGFEYAATDNLILRAEYRYTDFGSKTFHGLFGEGEGKIKLNTHDVRVGLAYKF